MGNAEMEMEMPAPAAAPATEDGHDGWRHLALNTL